MLAGKQRRVIITWEFLIVGQILREEKYLHRIFVKYSENIFNIFVEMIFSTLRCFYGYIVNMRKIYTKNKRCLNELSRSKYYVHHGKLTTENTHRMSRLTTRSPHSTPGNTTHDNTEHLINKKFKTQGQDYYVRHKSRIVIHRDTIFFFNEATVNFKKGVCASQISWESIHSPIMGFNILKLSGNELHCSTILEINLI